jgi:alkylhydroperoxidase family enzyme
LAVNRFRTVLRDNSFVANVLRVTTAIHNRWLSFRFACRFYRQARNAQPQSLDLQRPVPAEDFTQSLFRRSVPPSIHALVQLRVASQLASIEETTTRSRLCHEIGWSSEQIGAALLGNFNAALSEREKLVLRYTDDMTRTPIDVDPQVVRQLRACFSQFDLLELTASIAHENFRVRLANANRKLG